MTEADKIKHMVWSLGLGLFLGALAGPTFGLFMAFMVGLVKECVDERFGSGFCLFDMAGNAIGLMLAAFIFFAWQLI